MEFIEENLIYLIPFLGLLGLLVMFLKSTWVSKQDPGDEKMVGLSNHIAKGAMAFLVAEWKVLGVFSVFAAIILAFSGTVPEANSSPLIAVSFFIGAFFSALAGYFWHEHCYQSKCKNNSGREN